MRIDGKLAAEIEAARAEKGAQPQDLLEWAREHPDSEIHAKFTWDDSEAAEKWRLTEARTIIRSYTILKPRTLTRVVRALVSVDGSGTRSYRDYTLVNGNERLRLVRIIDFLKRAVGEIDNLSFGELRETRDYLAANLTRFESRLSDLETAAEAESAPSSGAEVASELVA